MVQIVLFEKQKYRHIHRKQTYGYQGRNGRVWDEFGDWDRHIYTMCV